MGRSSFYSLILHILLLAISFFYMQEQKKETPAPFIARIVTPEEAEAPPGHQQKPPQEKITRMPTLPKNLPDPKKFWATPKQSMRGKDAQTMPQQTLPAEKNKSGIPGESRSDTADKQDFTSPVIGPEGILKQGTEGGDDFKKSQPSDTGPKTPSKPLKEKLFDKNIISRLAKKETTKPDSGITFDTSDYKYYGYMQRLKEKVEGMWKYPQEAAEKKIYGDVYVRFVIKKTGRLGAVELVRTSGYKNLDDAAISALKDAEPYWPLPEDWDQDSLTITGHFVYSLYGTYIR